MPTARGGDIVESISLQTRHGERHAVSPYRLNYDGEVLLKRLWIYTNYDCNLSCSYCIAESFVGTERKGLTLPQVCRLIDEAVEIGMTELFLIATDPDLLISPQIFPLREAVEQVREIRESLLMVTGGAANRFR